MGDAVRLQQVFSNVLKNAIKFTPEKGTVTVRAGSVGSEYFVQIADNGIGMKPEEVAVIFEAFRQGEHAGTQKRFGGLGLGLAISREFLKFHQGTITASSEGRGKGSTFTIKLPLLHENRKGDTEHFKTGDFERGAHFFRNRKVAA
jgi:signal transduction histidine kinase